MLQLEQTLQGRYQLTQLLGQNAGRQTWLATDLETQAPVVVKLLAFSDQVQWDQVKLFEREAQVLRQLHHPQIPQYQDYFCIDDRILWFCLVQSYIPGRSFKEYLAQGKTLHEPQARQLAEEILNVLIYLHGLSPPVLHRDIKPSNILFGDDQAIYLVDFGAVQDRAAAEGATFTVVGTYGYAPLEQFGGRATFASDLYALGATLIHLLTGIAPADLPQQSARLQFREFVRLNPGFVRWLEKLTEPNLERRFQTAQEARQALHENEAAITALIHSQPQQSSIQLQKTADRLQVSVPRAIKVSSLGGLALWGVAIVFFSSTAVFGSLTQFVCLLIGIGSVGGWWMLHGGTTQVRFDAHSFAIIWKVFGFKLSRKRGQVAEIDQVFATKTAHPFWQKKDKELSEVVLAVGVQEYPITRLEPPLTEAECEWLAAEINQWLGLASR
ncbi:MAG: serine/threonine protein kinase [Phormidium tanganyikae FI6-MK23]|jgi:serine/threonine protein kinase|nr:serine/threonine protein kinase [Phormidium tanganyikae FI6-MK23]